MTADVAYLERDVLPAYERARQRFLRRGGETEDLLHDAFVALCEQEPLPPEAIDGFFAQRVRRERRVKHEPLPPDVPDRRGNPLYMLHRKEVTGEVEPFTGKVSEDLSRRLDMLEAKVFGRMHSNVVFCLGKVCFHDELEGMLRGWIQEARQDVLRIPNLKTHSRVYPHYHRHVVARMFSEWAKYEVTDPYQVN